MSVVAGRPGLPAVSVSPVGDVWVDLVDVLAGTRPAFHADALCREAPAEVSWFVERGGDPGPAKAVCQRCLVVGECRVWAADQGADLEGVWAGMSKRDRMVMRRGMAV